MGILEDFHKWKKKVDRAIPEALMDDVKQVVEEDFIEATNPFVYSAYSPILYIRRYSGGGIQTVSSIDSKLAGKYTLVMEQTAPANSNYPQGKNALEWVEAGSMGVPVRQYYAPLEAMTTPHAQQALVVGLHKRGL